MKRLFVLAFATGFLLAACNEQQEPESPKQEQRERAALRTVSDFQQSVDAVLEDADRQISQLADKAGTREGTRRQELEAMLEDLRRRHAALRRDVCRMERGREMRAKTLRTEIRHQLNGLQRELEVAQLKTIRSRRQFEREIQSHVEGVETQIEQLDHRLQRASRPVRSDYREPISELEDRHRRLQQRLTMLQVSGSGEFGDLRPQIVRDVAALKADVRHLANEVDRAANSQPES